MIWDQMLNSITSIFSSSSEKGQIIGKWWAVKSVLNGPFEDAISNQTLLEKHKFSVSIVSDMRALLANIKSKFMNENGSIIDYEGVRNSSEFDSFKTLSKQLTLADERCLSPVERKAFFINLYNALIMHSMIEGYLTCGDNIITRLVMYATAAYNIGGRIYSLNDIEHGILRNNRPSPAPYSDLPLAPNDPRLDSCVDLDPRIHFALNCGAKSCPPIMIYKSINLNASLDRATSGFLSNTVSVDVENKTVTLSQLFEWYHSDFGGTTSEVLRWIQHHCSSELSAKIESLLQSESNDINVIYAPYDWSLNSK